MSKKSRLTRWLHSFLPSPRLVRRDFRPQLECVEERLTPSVSFAPAAIFAVDPEPNSVTVGDFNGDGNADLATANTYFSHTVSVLLGDGLGGFAAAANFGVGYYPNSVTVGDFNGDGNADLATADTGSYTVSVLLGDGLGGFAAAANFGVGSNPWSVTVGDFNGDGNADLATANQSSSTVSVLLGDGLGGFAATADVNVGSSPQSVTVGDFNDDGNADLATANAFSSTVSVLLGDGLGGFAAAANFGVGSNPWSVTVGDFNDDGNADLATANVSSNNVSVLLGDGLGGFAAAANFGGFYQAVSVTVGDFNGDGKADLAAAFTNDYTYSVRVLLGDGLGGVAAAGSFDVDWEATSVTVGDFNGDGKADLVTSNGLESTVSVLLNTSTPPPNQPPATPVDTDGAANSVAEGAANGTTVGVTAFANDPNGDTVTYSLTDDAVGRFAINGITGVITVANGLLLNYESATSHTITVKAVDGAGGESASPFTIAVANVNPTAPADGDSVVNELPVGSPNDTIVGITAASSDVNGPAVTYSLTTSAGGRFDIDPGTGVVTVADAGMLASNAIYTITVQASDGAGGTATTSFTITVLSASTQIDLTIGYILQLRQDGVLSNGQANSLIVKLNGAKKSLAMGHTNTAINHMNAFKNQVNAFRGNLLSIPVADDLLNDADDIILSILSGQ